MPGFTPNPADEVAIATIRTLAVDVVGKANSGHPGLSSTSPPFTNSNPNQVYRCASRHGCLRSYPFFAVCGNSFSILVQDIAYNYYFNDQVPQCQP
jgi:hypothetical protein